MAENMVAPIIPPKVLSDTSIIIIVIKKVTKVVTTHGEGY